MIHASERVITALISCDSQSSRLTTDYMAFKFGKQGKNALLSAYVEEVHLRNIELDPSGNLVSAHKSEDNLPESIEQHLQTSTHTLQYNFAGSNDHSPLLNDGTSPPDTQ